MKKESLILLHGALGSKDQLVELKEKLSSAFDVYSFNFTGHGGKLIPPSFSIDLFVKDTIQFIDENHLGPVHFFGYSMGGYVALKLALDFPDSVKKIITLGTKFHWDPESAAKEVKMMNPEIIEQKIPKFASLLSERHATEDWKKVMSHTAEMMTQLGAGKAITAIDFNAIGSEVLVCVGSEDNMVTREESERTVNALRNGSIKVIDGFKHPIESVDMAVLSQICISFL